MMRFASAVPAIQLAVFSLLADAQCTRARQDGVALYDGFETPSLGEEWEASRFAPGAVEMQSEIVRAGRGAAKITVRSGERFEAGINGNSDSERAELLEARELTSRQDAACEYSFSMFFPKDFPIVPTRLVIAQWKQYCPEGRNCSDDSPVLAIRYMSGALTITQDIEKKQTVLWEEKNEFRNRWLDFKVQVRFSTGGSGRVKAWLGDQQVVNFKGATANSAGASTGYGSPGWFYFKMGLYRNVMAEPMTVFIDEYRKRALAADTL